MMANTCHGNVTTVLDDPRPAPDEPGIIEFMAQSEGFFPDDAAGLGMADMRACYDRLCQHFHGGRPAGMQVEDMTAPGHAGPIPLRRYAPAQGRDGAGLIYLHGGGYVLGSLDSHDDICCGLAELSGATVIAVDYRLAPEHRFPAAFEDSAAAVHHILSSPDTFGIDPARTALGGDSAGGNLTAAVCLKRRDEGLPLPSGQVLVYPALGGDMSRGSYVSRAYAPGLTTQDMAAYDGWYTGPDNETARHSKFRTPLLETDYAGLPRAFMVACEWDPLRDDCFDYAARLQAAGVQARVRHEPELIHASLRARRVSPAAGAMFAAIAAAVREFTA
jgi:acetyl esterase